jgi:hypothetical protein
MLLKCHMWWQSLRPSERVVLGVVIQSLGAPQMTEIGIAGGTNGLSDDERAYLAAGGLGILIGDGRIQRRSRADLDLLRAVARRILIDRAWLPSIVRWTTFAALHGSGPGTTRKPLRVPMNSAH